MAAKVKTKGGFVTIIYVIILFFSLDAFGLKPYELGRYSGSLYGTLNLVSIGVMLLLLLLIPQNIKIFKSPIGKAFLLIGVLIVFYSAIEVIQGRLSNLTNLLVLKSYFLFFTTLVVYEKAGMDRLWSTLKHLSLVCSVVAIVVIALSIPGLSIQFSKASGNGDVGVLMPTGPVIAFGMFAYITSYFKRGRTQDLLFALLCMGACFLQQHKGVLISMAVTLLLSYAINKKMNLKTVVSGFALIIFAYFAFNILLSKTGFSGNELIEQFSELGSGGHSDETAMLRFLMLGNAYDYVISHLGLGIGLNWQEYDVVEYVHDAFVLSPVMDSGYYDIIIMFGIYGVIVYIYCFITTFRVLNKERKMKEMSIQQHIYINALLVLFVYILMTSVTGEFFILDYSYMFYITLALSLIMSSTKSKPITNFT